MVAHYVRDVGVASSSPVIPTRKGKQPQVVASLFALQGRALCPSATRMANKLSMPTHWLRTGPNHPYPPLHVGRDTSFTTRAYQSSTMPISAATSSALTLPVSKMPTQELPPDDRATISFIVSPFCFARMLMPSLLPFFMPVNSL